MSTVVMKTVSLAERLQVCDKLRREFEAAFFVAFGGEYAQGRLRHSRHLAILFHSRNTTSVHIRPLSECKAGSHGLQEGLLVFY